ncbi:MAG: sugar transferase, partial [Clostridiaceae bacterium]|nr:sugar transferase [Clostridiaceae bacterium]
MGARIWKGSTRPWTTIWKGRSRTLYKRFGKRLLDLILALLGLALLWPLFLVLALLVYFKLGSPVLYRVERPGKDEKLFTLVKFRTMTEERDDQGQLLPDWERLSPLGHFLRSSSLDELPELWCILKGDMSFVGPRPLSKLYLPYYREEEARRHQVRPGLTGLAQISGRNTLDWDERLALDVEYVDQMSFGKDLSILWRTLGRVFSRKDVVVA